MEAKCYRAMRRAQGKMLREYFSGVSVESLSRRYGYMHRPEKSLPKFIDI